MKLFKANLLILTAVLLCSLAAMADNRGDLPLPASGNVTLPLDEYNRLVTLASKTPKKTDAPPLAYAIKRAGLKLHVTDAAVLGTVQLEGEVYKKGATKVALTRGLTILDAHQDGHGLPLEQENGMHVAVLPGPADFSVALDAGLPLSIDAGRAWFSLPVPSAGSVRLTLVIPGDHTNVNLSPGLITNRSSENGQTTIEATLVPGQPTSVWWATREVTTPVVRHEVRFLSDVKTLVSVSEADLSIAALASITMLQGEPTQFEVAIPAGYEVTGASGASLESNEVQAGVLVLKVTGAAQHTYQFLISMERSIDGTKAEAPFLGVKDTQRETGEVLVEGSGTMELTATEGGGLKRMDLKEVSPYLRSLSRFPLQAAFRYHRQATDTPSLSLAWVRFPDSSVLAAVAERADVTTLVTSEGKSLTEVKLIVRNQAQPFLKVDLPAGATILSAEVAGEKVKPVQGADGNRVPLMRPGFRPTDAYQVSFVFMHSGTAFAKKGDAELSLPKMDIAITIMEWEVFLPEQYKVRDLGGNVIAADLLPGALVQVSMSSTDQLSTVIDAHATKNIPLPTRNYGELTLLSPGAVANGSSAAAINGTITDTQGAVIAGTTVTAIDVDRHTKYMASTDASGIYTLAHLPIGRYEIVAEKPGFRVSKQSAFAIQGNQVAEVNMTLGAGASGTVVEVQGTTPMLQTSTEELSTVVESNAMTIVGGSNSGNNSYGGYTRTRESKKHAEPVDNTASQNVVNLQKRVAGVLPVRVDIPRAGTSYRFVRPLVLDEETRVSFNYKSK